MKKPPAPAPKEKKIHPIETIKESALIQVFGKKLADEFESVGVTKENAYLLEAMFKVDRKFWLKLQEEYDKN